MSEKPPIIAFGSNAWGEYWATRQHILSGLANRGWPVAYSNGAFFVWDRFRLRWNCARWRDRQELLDQVQVYWPGRWQMRWPKFPAWDRFVVNAHAKTMLEQFATTSKKKPIAYLFHPQYLTYLDALGDCRIVYHADDSFPLMGQWTQELAEMQEQLIQRADLVLASSPRIAAGLSGATSVKQLHNGVDAKAFIDVVGHACPPSLKHVPQPRIGYIGHLNNKVDFTLVHEITKRRPNWHWVFVGSRVSFSNFSDENRRSLEACLMRPNVHTLGPKPYKSLPQYMVHMDVNVLCYKTKEGGWWTDIYPLKLHEYLAAGKPVVGASIETIRGFSSVIAIATTVDEWIAAISAALESGGVGTRAERQRIASNNDWQTRISKLEKWLL